MAYTVKKGDTLNKIAAANGISLTQLLALNPNAQWGSNPDLIQPGWTVNLPGDTGGGTTTPTAPPVDPNAPVTDTPPASVGGTTIPQGAKIVVVRNPEGSDSPKTWYLVYEWQGVEIAYEVGDDARFVELFGPASDFTAASNITVVNQQPFDDAGYVLAGSVDQIVGSTESLGSQIEREVRALGLEDLPEWLAGSPEALLLVAEATAQEWSSGRLWQELSGTTAFTTRFGGAIDQYLTGNVTISDAVSQLVADEDALRVAIRPFLPPGEDIADTDFLQELLVGGWTPGSAAQVLEQADILRSDPTSLAQANAILGLSGLGSLDEVEFLNALAGFGAPDVVEALNTAAAGTALVNAGLDDVDLDLLMEIVDTSGQLLTVESFASLAQELAFNTIRFAHEIDENKLGFNRDDLIAAAFGQVNPNGKTPGEVINALGRFQRDRQAAGTGFDQSTGFQDEKGRLRIAGLGSL